LRIVTASTPVDSRPIPQNGLVDDDPSDTANHATVDPLMLFVM
jgi:hypothetical protein